MARKPLTPTEEFVAKLRRNVFMRKIGHEPLAPNCHWVKPGDITNDKKTCQLCARIDRRFGIRIFGGFAPLGGYR